MTFSEFVKIMYVYCGGKKTQAEFIRHITDLIMEGQPGRTHADGSHQNPMWDKDDRTLQSYFNGSRTISYSDAKLILRKIDLYKFEMYLDDYLSDEAQKLLGTDISNMTKKDVKNSDVAKVCADLFEKIIRDLADDKKE